MAEISLSPLGCNGKLSLDDSVIAVFATGSFVNGYSREDSDIDIVAVSTQETRPIQDMDNKVSLHYLHESILNYYEKAKYYCVLRNVALMNPEYVSNLSAKTKKEMVIREAKKMKKRGKAEFNANELLKRYFTREWGIIEPWRMKPMKRIRNSEESWQILEQEYKPVFEELVNRRFLVEREGKYSISPTAVLNDDSQQISSAWGKFSYIFRKSYGGVLYLRHLGDICRNIREIR